MEGWHEQRVKQKGGTREERLVSADNRHYFPPPGVFVWMHSAVTTHTHRTERDVHTYCLLQESSAVVCGILIFLDLTTHSLLSCESGNSKDVDTRSGNLDTPVL